MKKKNIEEDNVKKLIICVASVLIIWGLFFVAKQKIIHMKEIESITDNSTELFYRIEGLEQKETELEICGWVMERKEGGYDYCDEIEVYLYSSKEEELIEPERTEIVHDVDNQRIFSDDERKTISSFNAIFNRDEITKREEKLEVVVSCEDIKSNIRTGMYIEGEKLVYETGFVDAGIMSKDIEDIVNNGYLRAKNEEYGVYVYQQAQRLYWICDKSSIQGIDEKVKIKLRIYANSEELIPSETYRNGYDRQDFYYDEPAYLYTENDLYMVLYYDLSDLYNATTISTGFYNSENLWGASFSLIYN